jgi:hypothetical protein
MVVDTPVKLISGGIRLLGPLWVTNRQRRASGERPGERNGFPTLVIGDKVRVDRQGGHVRLAPEPHRDGHVARPGGQAQDDERVPEGDPGIEPVTS